MGFIPNEQNNFVEKIRDEIRKQKLERVQGAGLNINNPTMVGGIPNQPSSSGLQQQQQGMQQIIVSQQQSMPGGLPVSSMGVGPSTMTMAGGTLTMASGKYSVGKISAIITHVLIVKSHCIITQQAQYYYFVGASSQQMGMINTPRLAGANVDPQRLQRINALQQQLQQELSSVGQAAGQSVTSIGQQQGIGTGQETMIMSQPRMINAPAQMQQQQQNQGGLRQVKGIN